MQMIDTRVMTQLTALSIAELLAGCASQGRTSAPDAKPAAATQASSYGPTKNVRSSDGEIDDEIIGNVVAGGKFSKLQMGMKMSEVLALVGGPDGMDSHETGKR